MRAQREHDACSIQAAPAMIATLLDHTPPGGRWALVWGAVPVFAASTSNGWSEKKKKKGYTCYFGIFLPLSRSAPGWIYRTQ